MITLIPPCSVSPEKWRNLTMPNLKALAPSSKIPIPQSNKE